jgi:hypothetical protein
MDGITVEVWLSGCELYAELLSYWMIQSFKR